MRTSLCKQEAGAEAKASQKSMVCCHQKCFRLHMFNSARMTAWEVVEGTPHKRLRYNIYFCSNCLRTLLAAESVGLCMPQTGNHSERQGQEWIETSETSDNQCHYIVTVCAFAAQLPKMLLLCWALVWCGEQCDQIDERAGPSTWSFQLAPKAGLCMWKWFMCHHQWS